MSHKKGISAKEALTMLKKGNEAYLRSNAGIGDVSDSVRAETTENGQNPYAIIIACSDSRVIPEVIFNSGIGDLFVIRVAGNVIDSHQLGSIEYAAGHLGTRLVLVLGHTHCGAVHAALHPDVGNRYIKYIIDDIREAIRDEKNEDKAAELNVLHSMQHIRDALVTEPALDIEVVGAIYHIDSGEVRFL